jgi:hypothetical protein
MKKTAILYCCALLLSCNTAIKKEDHQLIEVKKTDQRPILDGKATEQIWSQVPWYAIDQNWMGNSYPHDDFSGRFKISWDAEALYLLVEIVDDSLFDKTKDPLKLYWDDDSLEIFLDADNSGGLHQFSYNAFAYHIALDGTVVDLAPDKLPRTYNDHITSSSQQKDKTTTWEIAIKVFDDNLDDIRENRPKKLANNDKLGFVLAYCDNDGSMERENFIGSVFIPGEDKNQAWIDADLFGTLILKE